MKIVINNCYGGITQEHDSLRTDPAFIKKVELGYNGDTENYEHLVVLEIPDEATDYYVDEYDGLERLIYVIDGKICFLEPEELY